jgi:ribosomal protein L37AE/L43A
MSRDSAAKACPYCNSSDVVGPAKPSATGYWRCASCGEMWHPDRIGAHHSYPGSVGARTRIAGRS